MCFAPQPRALFKGLNFQKCSDNGVLLTSKSASRHSGVQFLISHLTRWLRTRRFSEPTFDPDTGPQNIAKPQCFATFLSFRAPGSSFFWLFLFSDLLYFFLYFLLLSFFSFFSFFFFLFLLFSSCFFFLLSSFFFLLSSFFFLLSSFFFFFLLSSSPLFSSLLLSSPLFSSLLFSSLLFSSLTLPTSAAASVHIVENLTLKLPSAKYSWNSEGMTS